MATVICNMRTRLDQDGLLRQQEIKAFELKMITLMSTITPNPAQVFQLPSYQQHPSILPLSPQQNPVTPSPQPRTKQDANPDMQEERHNDFMTKGGFQMVKRDKNSPDREQSTVTLARYQCTYNDDQTINPLTQEEQKHHSQSDASI